MDTHIPVRNFRECQIAKMEQGKSKVEKCSHMIGTCQGGGRIELPPEYFTLTSTHVLWHTCACMHEHTYRHTVKYKKY